MAAAAAASTATAIYKHTYTLGRSLYVPLTSRCNSIPLPSTRGPGFLLPRGVAEALVRVRNADHPGSVMAGVYDDWLEDDSVPLPPYNLPLVNGLYHFSNDLPEHLQQQRQNVVDQSSEHEMDDFLQPSIQTLVDEVSSRLDRNSESDQKFHQVVIAGEGEPTLRMDALLAVARSVQSFPLDDNTKESNKERSSLPVRVITNGLCFGIPNLGYSPSNNKRSGVIVPMHRHMILRDMLDAGISQLSVALNTANRHEYDVLMEPCCYTGGGMIAGEGDDGNLDVDKGHHGSGGVNDASAPMPGTAHDIVCEFILEATKLGMDVDITGVLSPGIDKEETERLARMLLSVGPKYAKYKKQRTVRWRQYFD